MFRIAAETPEDAEEIEYLFDLAFAPGRTALSSYRLREGIAPLAKLSCVIRDDYDALAGAVRFWPVRVANKPALLLGPIAIHPVRQGEGLGALLMSEGLARAQADGWLRVLLVGDLPYYQRFGFRRVDVQFPQPTNPQRVLGLALADGALNGITGPVRRWTEGPEVDT
ncbi:MAG: N-acetyltransferase [Pseudomonadota bacterium]